MLEEKEEGEKFAKESVNGWWKETSCEEKFQSPEVNLVSKDEDFFGIEQKRTDENAKDTESPRKKKTARAK